MSLNLEELRKEMAKQPQVREGTRRKAEQVKKYLELRWPEVNQVSDKQRAFLAGDDDVIKVTEATVGVNRPTHVVTVRHPGAVDRQAKNGFVTKAVKDVE